MQKALYGFLGFLVLLALLGDLLANSRPLWCRVEGQTYWPAFRAWVRPAGATYGVAAVDALAMNNSWATLWPNHAVLPPVPFSASAQYTKQLPPGSLEPGQPARFRHWLGTDERGRDVLAGTIAGARTAVWTGLLAMLVALVVGGLLGAVSGFWGDDGLRARRGAVWLTLLGVVPAWWLGFVARYRWWEVPDSGSAYAGHAAIFVCILLIFRQIGNLLSRRGWLAKPVRLPLDLVVMRVAEVFEAAPALILILAIVAVLPQRSLATVMILVGVLSWPGVARLLRAELLRIRSLEYVAAARNLGFSEGRILWRHALPNALRPMLTVCALSMASAVILEASLSFLGFGGTDLDTVTWGRMLHTARTDTALWWVWLPPGLSVCALVAALYEVSLGR
jgi:peptide/nickel transport system permease protein